MEGGLCSAAEGRVRPGALGLCVAYWAPGWPRLALDAKGRGNGGRPGSRPCQRDQAQKARGISKEEGTCRRLKATGAIGLTVAWYLKARGSERGRKGAGPADGQGPIGREWTACLADGGKSEWTERRGQVGDPAADGGMEAGGLHAGTWLSRALMGR